MRLLLLSVAWERVGDDERLRVEGGTRNRTETEQQKLHTVVRYAPHCSFITDEHPVSICTMNEAPTRRALLPRRSSYSWLVCVVRFRWGLWTVTQQSLPEQLVSHRVSPRRYVFVRHACFGVFLVAAICVIHTTSCIKNPKSIR